MRRKVSSLTLLLGLLPFIMVLGNSMFFPILPDIQAEMSLSTLEISIFLSIFSIPAALLIPFVGILSDRIGRRVVVLFSLAFLLIGCSLSIMAPYFIGGTSYHVMLAGRLFQGIGAGGTAPLAIVLVGDLYDGTARSQTLGLLEVFNGIGKVVSPIIGAMSLLLLWESTFYLYFLVCLICFIGLYKILPIDRPSDQAENMACYMKNMLQLLRIQIRWIGPIFLAGSACLFLLFGLLFYLSFELDVMYTLNPLMKGVYLAFPLISLTLVSYFSGRVIGNDINKMKRYIMTGLLLLFFSFTLLLAFRGLASLIILISLTGVGLGLFLPAANTAVTTSVRKEERGMVVSFYSTARFLGVAFGPITFSVWMANVQDMLFYSLAIIGCVTVILFVAWTSIPILEQRMD